MATMDRAQIDALATLAANAQSSLLEQRAILDRFKPALDGRMRSGILFCVIVALILAGIFWYARKLQLTHENLLIEQDRAESERRNRLASVGEVCYACAHGIRNPLASVVSSAQMLQIRGALDQQDGSRVSDILATCDLLGQRVSKLLTFAHARSVPMVTLAPEEILDNAAREIEGQLAVRNVELLRRYEARGTPFQGSGTWLVQAVGELLSNALAALPDGGTITLVSAICASDPKQIELGVIDNGPGIPQNIRDQVCVLFFTQRADGHGIGLASVQRAADLHRGSVIIADAQSGGADIRLRIPRG
jgi:signal transduction histidine kinase